MLMGSDPTEGTDKVFYKLNNHHILYFRFILLYCHWVELHNLQWQN